MARIVFRVLIGLTLAVMFLERRAAGQMSARIFMPFYYWFVASALVFAAFGLFAAWKAYREPENRRAYLFDVLLAAAWIPYWFANFR